MANTNRTPTCTSGTPRFRNVDAEGKCPLADKEGSPRRGLGEFEVEYVIPRPLDFLLAEF